MTAQYDIDNESQFNYLFNEFIDLNRLSTDEENSQDSISSSGTTSSICDGCACQTTPLAAMLQSQAMVPHWIDQVYTPYGNIYSQTTFEYRNISEGTYIPGSSTTPSTITLSESTPFSNPLDTVALPPTGPNRKGAPFHCGIAGCQYVSGRKSFRSRAILRRHMRTVHPHGFQHMTAVFVPSTAHSGAAFPVSFEPSIHKFDCPEPGCRRTGSLAFSRKDNLRTHLRNVHDKTIEKRRHKGA